MAVRSARGSLVVRCSGTEIGFPYVGPVEGYPCITGAGRLPEREHLAAWRASRAARVEAPGCDVLCALWRRGSAPPSPTFRARGSGVRGDPGNRPSGTLSPLCGVLPACTRSECIP